MDAIEVLRPGGEHRSSNRAPLADVAGDPFAEMGMAPPLLANSVVQELRRGPRQGTAEIIAVLGRAGAAFAADDLHGETPDAYCRAVARVGGVPIAAVRRTVGVVAKAAEHIADLVADQRPRGAAQGWDAPDTRGGSAVWVRKGDVLVVNAPGNHPGPHSEWLSALALGYRVAIRPSAHDPFTPRRLIRALLEAGLDPSMVALVPCEDPVVDTLVFAGDLAMVTGNDNVVDRYRSDPRVLARGPGRSKLLITAEQRWSDHLDTIVDAVASDGGTSCINATSVLVEGDSAPLAEALAERLGALPVHPPEHPDAVLPVTTLKRAADLESWVHNRAVETPLLTDGVVAGDLGDGSAALRPAVFALPDGRGPEAAFEMPFPCVWVGRWTRQAGVGALRGSIALTLVTDDGDLVEASVAEPSISNVYVGDHPTSWFRPALPHDDYLGPFLMRCKTVVR